MNLTGDWKAAAVEEGRQRCCWMAVVDPAATSASCDDHDYDGGPVSLPLDAWPHYPMWPSSAGLVSRAAYEELDREASN